MVGVARGREVEREGGAGRRRRSLISLRDTLIDSITLHIAPAINAGYVPTGL